MKSHNVLYFPISHKKINIVATFPFSHTIKSQSHMTCHDITASVTLHKRHIVDCSSNYRQSAIWADTDKAYTSHAVMVKITAQSVRT